MIEVEGLSKNYGNHRAIENVTFSIKKGEIVGLLGLNGAGKSTILKILGCFLMPSGGKARVGGHDIHDDPDAIRRIIGYLPDSAPLYEEMSVQSYLEYVAQLKDVSSADLARKVKEAIEKTNLQDVRDVMLGALSHGFQQRVAIAQAMVHNPEVLILDEPINGLDPVQIVEMRDLILSLRGRHTVILSSHILSEITKTCDRILIIDQGKLVAEGKETDLEGKMAKSMRMSLEVLNPGQIVTKLQGIAGVKSAKVGLVHAGVSKISIECESDVRTDISKLVVEAGCGLVAMNKEDGGLESVFMGLIQGGNKASERRERNQSR